MIGWLRRRRERQEAKRQSLEQLRAAYTATLPGIEHVMIPRARWVELGAAEALSRVRGVKIIELAEHGGAHLCRAERAEAELKTAQDRIVELTRMLGERRNAPDTDDLIGRMRDIRHRLAGLRPGNCETIADAETRILVAEQCNRDMIAEIETLRLEILGDFDAPGRAMSVPLQAVLDVHRANRRGAIDEAWTLKGALRAASILFRLYEAEHRRKANAPGVSPEGQRVSTAKADRNAEMAANLENLL